MKLIPKWLERWIVNQGICVAVSEILSTNEGQEFARKFLADEKNKRFALYEPLFDWFNYCWPKMNCETCGFPMSGLNLPGGPFCTTRGCGVPMDYVLLAPDVLMAVQESLTEKRE